MVLRPMRGVSPKNPLTDFPYLASAKIDGMRALVKDGVVYSKTMKPIPNQQVQRMFGHLYGADGELTVGPAHKCFPNDDVFARSRGPIMSRDQEAAFQFWVFDRWDQPDRAADERCRYVFDRTIWEVASYINFVAHQLVSNQSMLDTLLADYLDAGYEGLMLRQVMSPYKYGQSTEKEGYLLKLKPMDEAEAMVLDVVQQLENTNLPYVDELGYTKRSSAKQGKVGKGTFGAFLVRDLKTGAEFSVGNGPGLTASMRKQLWAERATLVGQYIRYRYQAIGTQDAPRLPQFLGFRPAWDISEVGE